MADLLSHSLLAYLLGGRTPSRRAMLLLITGTILPDVLAHLPLVRFVFLPRAWRFDVPIWVRDGFFVFHSPLPYALLIWAVALCLPAAGRRQAFISLLLGGWLHIAVDLLQLHLAGSPYFPAYPLLRGRWELGLFGTEASLYALPMLLALATYTALWRWRKHRHSVP